MCVCTFYGQNVSLLFANVFLRSFTPHLPSLLFKMLLYVRGSKPLKCFIVFLGFHIVCFLLCAVSSPTPHQLSPSTSFTPDHIVPKCTRDKKREKKIAQEQVNEWAVSSWYITQPLCSFGWLIPTNMTYKFPCSHSHVGIFGLTNAKIYARLCLDATVAAAVLIVNITNFLFTYNMN